MNVELADYAKRKGFPMPKDHFFATLDINMLRNDAKKYDVWRNWNPDRGAFSRTFRIMKKYFSTLISDKKMMTFDEAVAAAVRDGAPGKYWKDLGCQTKGDVFDKHLQQLRDMVGDVFAGKNVRSLWQLSPKTEVRTVAKLFNLDPEKNKQRTFLCGDTLNYIVSMMLFGNVVEEFNQLGNTQELPALGFSMFYGGWDKLARDLGNFMQHCFDISCMEGSFSDIHLMELHEFVASFVRDLNPHASGWHLISMIFSEMCDFDGWLGVKNGQMPSGSFLTLLINTLGLFSILLYSIIKDNPSSSDSQILKMLKNVRGKLMGDDSILRESQHVVNLCRNAYDLGFVMTYEADPGPITAAKFLNFGFSYDLFYRKFVPKPNFDKLWASVFYNRKRDSWRFTLAKLYGIRILVYPFKEHRDMVDDLITYIWQQFKDLLMAETQYDELITLHSLISMKLTDEEMVYLIYGFESGSTKTIDNTTINRILATRC